MESNLPRRAGAPFADGVSQFGLLTDLVGTWMGSGFNLISLPLSDRASNPPFRLKLNATRESLVFNALMAPIPNRGFGQGDMILFGLAYLQIVGDAITNEPLHFEPGLWLNVPPVIAPAAPANVVRLANIPHGTSLLAQGNALRMAGRPNIIPVSSMPIDHQSRGAITDPDYLAPFNTTPLPTEIPQGAIENPNLVLTNAIQNQIIVETIVLEIATSPIEGLLNIPFIKSNAEATRFNATFWIEKVQQPDASGTFTMQLQYTQTVLLKFDGIDWPHISVATLVKH